MYKTTKVKAEKMTKTQSHYELQEEKYWKNFNITEFIINMNTYSHHLISIFPVN